MADKQRPGLETTTVTVVRAVASDMPVNDGAAVSLGRGNFMDGVNAADTAHVDNTTPGDVVQTQINRKSLDEVSGNVKSKTNSNSKNDED